MARILRSGLYNLSVIVSGGSESESGPLAGYLHLLLPHSDLGMA